MGEKKLGLVLSGGGARGAYEAGVVRYMAEIGMEPDMYAGASIGALNGAVLVSSGNLKHGARKLRTVWREIAMDTVVKVNPAMLGGLAVVAAARAILGPLPVWSTAKPALMKALSTTAEIEAFLKHMDADPFSQMLAKGLGAEELDAAQAANGGLADNTLLVELLARTVGSDAMQQGKPLWVSVVSSSDPVWDVVEAVLGGLGMMDTRPAEFYHVQSRPLNEQIRLLLASAALPILFSAQQVGDHKFRDGGLGGMRTSQGNTPITPLVEAGCTHCIVVHLSDGAMWNRRDFPNVDIIEVRPKDPIRPKGRGFSTLNFSPDLIEKWMEQGYRDAERCIGNALWAVRGVHARRRASLEMQTSVEALINDGLEDRLNKI